MAITEKTKLSDKELIELGKKIEFIFETGYVTKGQALSFAVLKGVAYGLGIFLGGTIVIALLLWILGFFDQIPLVDRVIHAIQNSINNY